MSDEPSVAHPAEGGTVIAGAIVGILVYALPALVPIVPHLIVLVSALPAGITYLTNKFGLFGYPKKK